MSKLNPKQNLRCAIYTRKSTEEGLEQEFNSLDAQREACAAYVASQKHEGWSALPQHYDDGGFSGGSMDRPALRHLLADVEAGVIDVVVVYKVDRLTRALTDFARIVAVLDGAGASFVSVTQAFNTTTSMGRLTLNVLLSFAQFEREVTAERIRDKIAASKKKGMWMGGLVPIGYRAVEKKLVIEPGEATQLRHIFARYLDLGSVRRLKAELDASGIRTPVRHHRNGRQTGGAPFSRGKLYALLSNPLYAGCVRHKGAVHPGQHAAIIDASLWQAVQNRLAANRQVAAKRSNAASPSPLAGKLTDPDGRKMRPTHATKHGRRYRYYVSADLVEGSVATGARGWRIPAAEMETVLASVIAVRLRDPGFTRGLVARVYIDADKANAMLGRIGAIAAALDAPRSTGACELLRSLVTHVDLGETELCAGISFADLASDMATDPANALLAEARGITVTAPIRLARRGSELRLVLQGAAALAPKPDAQLIQAVIEARCRVADYVNPALDLSLGDLARCENIDRGDLSRSLQLAFLAPDIVERILDGDQPVSLTAQQLKRIGDLPLAWDDQRSVIA
ncbi:MAG TPA: recombinase family protein [Thermohalobaculum sp.]|nr:recombinase family protein [Thermohalobaculum sp.]